MIVRKMLSIKAIYQFTGHHLLWLAAWMSIVTVLYSFAGMRWIAIPWVPLSIIGTAVAFYVGFKNNQSYDRLWEGRKIWGAFVNNSRMLATTVKHFDAHRNSSSAELLAIKKRIIRRHIAYLYILRQQLLLPTQWEHVSLSWRFGSYNRKRRKAILTAFEKELNAASLPLYLEPNEQQDLEGAANKAVQLIDRQSGDIALLYNSGYINMMQHAELQRLVNSFYEEQGKAERIKRFPFPRQYATFSFVFVCIFVFLLPFGLVGEFSKLGKDAVWHTIPLGCLIGWVYVVMELIGDYSENPFEGLFNDIPMLSICRTIEIDLLEMLGQKNLPEPITPKDGVLI